MSKVLLVVAVSVVQLIPCSGQNDIRLSGGSGSFEGRVEILYEDHWGTVCNDTWDIRDVTVVCRMLGGRGAVASYSHGPGSGPILWNEVRCNGSEPRLSECPHNATQIDSCTHAEDAGVECSPKDYDLRLVGSPSPAEGRVELYRENEKRWGAVCYHDNFGKSEADVVCRQIGYPAGSMDSKLSLTSVQNTSLAFLGNLSCSGSETSVRGCSGSILRTTSCPSDLQATVGCKGTPETAEELSPGAIAGIAVGFAIVIIVCCLFSLNCNCQPCWKKIDERDDTGVYECNTSNAGNQVYSTTSNLKTDSESHGNSNVYSSTHDDPDPSMFVYAPKVPVVIMTSPPDEKVYNAEENGTVSGNGDTDAHVSFNDDFVVVTMTPGAGATEENVKSGETDRKERDGDIDKETTTDKKLEMKGEGKEEDGEEEEKNLTLIAECKDVTQEDDDEIPVTGGLLMSSESKAINKNTENGIQAEASQSLPPNYHDDVVYTINDETRVTKF